jgi:hypothetical protein
MPLDFELCRRDGGRIITVKGKEYGLEEGEYRRVCIDREGNWHMGEIRRKQGEERHG